jgi:hypothetical protein
MLEAESQEIATLRAEVEKALEANEVVTSILNYTTIRAETAEAEVLRLRKVLEVIATSQPSSIMMNGNALTSDPDHIKFCNNHMYMAQDALANGTGQEVNKGA